MGQFCYECTKCGGGKYQFDWEDYVVFFYNNDYRIGIYSGYGYVIYGNIKVYSMEFQKYFNFWGDIENTAPEFICLKCFGEDNISGKELDKFKYNILTTRNKEDIEQRTYMANLMKIISEK